MYILLDIIWIKL